MMACWQIFTEPHTLPSCPGDGTTTGTKRSVGRPSTSTEGEPRSKRVRGAIDLADFPADGWHNMRSLSHLLWSRRPTGETRTVLEFFNAVIGHRSVAGPKARSRILAGPPSTELLYCSAEQLLDGTLEARFRSLLWPDGSADPVPPAALGAVGIADVPADGGPANQRALTRSPSVTASTAKHSGGGGGSLLSAVTDGLPVAARDLLVDGFLDTPAMQPWRDIAFTKVVDRRTQNLIDVTTTMDLSDHPIVPQLREWLGRALEDVSARGTPPTFPVIAAQDPRPFVAVPEGCGRLPHTDGDGLWHRLLKGTVLEATLEPHRDRFQDGCHWAVENLAGELHQERVRHWHRLARGRTWFTWSSRPVGHHHHRGVVLEHIHTLPHTHTLSNNLSNLKISLI